LAGEDSFIYHATGDTCRIYSRKDMSKIIDAYKKHNLYHTTYFNAAKQYILGLSDIEKVRTFNYGDDISASVNDSVLKNIVKNWGVR
jgi:hypothetical protein